MIIHSKFKTLWLCNQKCYGKDKLFLVLEQNDTQTKRKDNLATSL